jgi:hypothetical protein
MDMVCHATDFNGLDFVPPRNAAQKWPKPFAQRRGDERAALFGAEHAMMVGTDV